MPKWEVHVTHTYFAGGDFIVEADDEDEAIELAKAQAERELVEPELVEVEIGGIRRLTGRR